MEMVIFQVKCGVITAISVKKETEKSWTKHSGGFIKKSNQNAKASASCFGEPQYFSCQNKALSYAKDMRSEVNHALDVSFASECDIENWIENGMDEEFLPDSRFKTY